MFVFVFKKILCIKVIVISIFLSRSEPETSRLFIAHKKSLFNESPAQGVLLRMSTRVVLFGRHLQRESVWCGSNDFDCKRAEVFEHEFIRERLRTVLGVH